MGGGQGTEGPHVAHLVSKGRLEPEKLEGPPFPVGLELLWQWFNELRVTRSVGVGGIEPLTYSEIDAWARLTDRKLRPHEVTALMTLDLATRRVPDDEEE